MATIDKYTPLIAKGLIKPEHACALRGYESVTKQDFAYSHATTSVNGEIVQIFKSNIDNSIAEAFSFKGHWGIQNDYSVGIRRKEGDHLYNFWVFQQEIRNVVNGIEQSQRNISTMEEEKTQLPGGREITNRWGHLLNGKLPPSPPAGADLTPTDQHVKIDEAIRHDCFPGI